jgi:hypothetical protein
MNIFFKLLILVFSIIIQIGNGCISTIVLSDKPGDIYDIIINNNDIYNILKMILVLNYIIVGILYMIIVYFLITNYNNLLILFIIFIILGILIFFTIGLSYIHKFIYDKNKEILNSQNNKNVMKVTVIMMYISLSLSLILNDNIN